MALVTCNTITMGYEGNKVIEDLSFQINSGDYLCIVGENGSGKTTLMKGLLGLLSPLKGHIQFGDGLKQNHIGYLPQQTVIQKDFPASVYEIVLSGCLNKKTLLPVYSKQLKQLAKSNMEKIKITHLKNKCYRELSGGQQQKVLLARALCAAEKLLILDEPVTGLDPLASNDMYEIISRLNQDGLTIVMVSHDITSAVNRSSHILHLDKNCDFYGSTHQYIHSDLGGKFLFNGCPCDDCSVGQAGKNYRKGESR